MARGLKIHNWNKTCKIITISDDFCERGVKLAADFQSSTNAPVQKNLAMRFCCWIKEDAKGQI